MSDSSLHVFDLHGYHQKGVNLKDQVYTSLTSLENKELHGSDHWMAAREAVNLIGISKVAFHKNRKSGKYAT
ncbi:hypothetical protein CR161_10280 [Prosthecochloris sp. ZM]|uniref:hypothetical protein n=1 Tax=Prosthecochloris sp. ZM TaxID=2283143 RepID=UPI000DF72DB4|nr:hypothetical protein [Prosthecochloris sp. ZM]RDD31052.1 hypothetical protein CR161_10280 [Prosthecochloris sp. ZM]